MEVYEKIKFIRTFRNWIQEIVASNFSRSQAPAWERVIYCRGNRLPLCIKECAGAWELECVTSVINKLQVIDKYFG